MPPEMIDEFLTQIRQRAADTRSRCSVKVPTFPSA
jgi:hypothetical protein